MRRRLLLGLGLACAAAALFLWAAPVRPARAQGTASAGAAGGDPALVAQGRRLFVSGCANCHGTDARGVAGKGPTLYGAGAAAADFYLTTGRMPLGEPRVEPVRSDRPLYDAGQRRALVAYVGSLGGPPVPAVTPGSGDVRAGFKAFADRCAGCHAITAQGGVVPNGVAPSLQQASATQIAEAVRVGPYLMPKFTERQVPRQELDDLTAYVLSTRSLPDRGGWGIGNIGPIPEGLVAWGFAIVGLLLVCRALGERA